MVHMGRDAADIEWQPTCQISSRLKYLSFGFGNSRLLQNILLTDVAIRGRHCICVDLCSHLHESVGPPVNWYNFLIFTP